MLIIENECKRSWKPEELMETDSPSLQWRVPDLITQGLNIIAGPPKIGKIWLSLTIAYATVTSGTVFGNKSVDECDVLFLSLIIIHHLLPPKIPY